MKRTRARESRSPKTNAPPRAPAKTADPSPRRRRLIAGLVLASAYVSLGAWYLWTRRAPRESSAEKAELTQLTDQPGQELFPSLSPDARSFAYSADGHLFLQRIGEKTRTDLTKDSKDQNWQPAFSPDGQRLAFRSEREGGGIFVTAVTGGEVKRLTNFGYNPAWSPDGKEILLATETIVDPGSRASPGSSLWAVNASTGARRPITDPKLIVDAVQPCWSPHALRIAYSSFQEGRLGLWTVSATGGNPIAVLQDDHVNWNPVWSPDGRYLYFASDRGSEMGLWRVTIDEKSGNAKGPSEAVRTEPGFSGFISLSRDGRRVAYVNSARLGNLEKLAFDPSKETVAGQPAIVTQGTRLVFGPHVSADGQWLAFFSWGKLEDIFVATVDGKGPWPVTKDAHSNRWPRWSPDGKRVAFQSDRTGTFQIWLAQPDGAGLRQITYSKEPAVQPVWSPDGRFLAYSTDSNCFILDASEALDRAGPVAAPSVD